MGSSNPGPVKDGRGRLRRFLVAPSHRDLYDSARASSRDPRQGAIAVGRAIALAAIIGGAVWFLLWEVAVHIWATR
jgi:hypothetical protein